MGNKLTVLFLSLLIFIGVAMAQEPNGQNDFSNNLNDTELGVNPEKESEDENCKKLVEAYKGQADKAEAALIRSEEEKKEVEKKAEAENIDADRKIAEERAKTDAAIVRAEEKIKKIERKADGKIKKLQAKADKERKRADKERERADAAILKAEKEIKEIRKKTDEKIHELQAKLDKAIKKLEEYLIKIEEEKRNRQQAETLFVTEGYTLEQIEQKTEVPLKQLEQWSTETDWKKKREAKVWRQKKERIIWGSITLIIVMTLVVFYLLKWRTPPLPAKKSEASMMLKGKLHPISSGLDSMGSGDETQYYVPPSPGEVWLEVDTPPVPLNFSLIDEKNNKKFAEIILARYDEEKKNLFSKDKVYLLLSDLHVSRPDEDRSGHARIFLNETTGRYQIEELGSSSGTKLRNASLEKGDILDLMDGITITIGNLKLTYHDKRPLTDTTVL